MPRAHGGSTARFHLAGWRRVCVFALALPAIVVTAGCGDSRLPTGSACTSATMCASRFCLRRAGGSVCASQCTSSADCAAGDVCGRFDYREPDPDSGELTGPSTEVVRVCRPSLRVACTTSSNNCTAPGERCATDLGMCVLPCAVAGDCASRLCVTTGCAPGLCAPFCDDPSECPGGWYCNTTTIDLVGHGRCEPITGIDVDAGAPPDAAMCSRPDASTPDASTPDAGDAGGLDAIDP